jgi:quinol monooxygenase YgiN
MAARYAWHGRFAAQAGQGNVLAEAVLALAQRMHSYDACLLYMVSQSPDDPDAVYVASAWTSRAVHDEIFAGEDVKALVSRAWALIADVEGIDLNPLGGKGL